MRPPAPGPCRGHHPRRDRRRHSGAGWAGPWRRPAPPRGGLAFDLVLGTPLADALCHGARRGRIASSVPRAYGTKVRALAPPIDEPILETPEVADCLAAGCARRSAWGAGRCGRAAAAHAALDLPSRGRPRSRCAFGMARRMAWSRSPWAAILPGRFRTAAPSSSPAAGTLSCSTAWGRFLEAVISARSLSSVGQG